MTLEDDIRNVAQPLGEWLNGVAKKLRDATAQVVDAKNPVQWGKEVGIKLVVPIEGIVGEDQTLERFDRLLTWSEYEQLSNLFYQMRYDHRDYAKTRDYYSLSEGRKRLRIEDRNGWKTSIENGQPGSPELICDVCSGRGETCYPDPEHPGHWICSVGPSLNPPMRTTSKKLEELIEIGRARVESTEEIKSADGRALLHNLITEFDNLPTMRVADRTEAPLPELVLKTRGFYLWRSTDVTGVTVPEGGEPRCVAVGVRFPDGQCALWWAPPESWGEDPWDQPRTSVAIWPNLRSLELTHLHPRSKTELRWVLE